jgi:2,4-dienoyl-CoA reductase-like NADH-dependent reductase (Old Yellow Enzyme family)
MTMYRSVDGLMNDYHVMLMGSSARRGFGLGISRAARSHARRPHRHLFVPASTTGRGGHSAGVSWNLGIPAIADQVIREELIDLVFLVHPALSNPHWPVWAAL